MTQPKEGPLYTKFKQWFDDEEKENGCLGTSQLERDQMFMAWVAGQNQQPDINRDEVVQLLLDWWTRKIDDSEYWNRLAKLLKVTNEEFLAS